MDGGGGLSPSSAPPMLGTGGVWALCERLRGEKLMVTSELSAVRQLHESIEERMHALGLLAWGTKLHQWALSSLLGSHPSVQPECTFGVLATIDAAQLEPAYRRLGHHHSTVAAVLNGLLASPRGVAELLHATDAAPAVNADAPSSSSTPLPVSSDELTRALHSLLYGHCIFPGDETLLVEVLCSLVHLQIVPHADPRLVLRRGTAAFPRLLRLFTDGLYAVKVFLTEALHDSVMLVLCQDDAYLDIDANKMLLRFKPEDRDRRFGTDPTTAEYERRVSGHRRMVVEKLVLLTHSFIKGIVDALHSLPASLVWLVQQLHAALVDGKRLQPGQAALICTDLLVTNLLCAAIANPETYGIISDTPVSATARTNLIQIGQLVQVLALSRHEPPPAIFQVFTRQFEESPIIGVVDRVLALSLPPMEGGLTGTASASDGGKDGGERYAPMQARCEDPIRRAHFIGSVADVNTIVAAIQGPAVSHITEAGLSKELRSLGRRLPSSPFASVAPSGKNSPQSSTAVPRSGTLRNLAEKVQTAASSYARPASSDGRRGGGEEQGGGGTTSPIPIPPEMVDVVVFTLGDDNEEKIGLRSEESFMEISGLRRRKKRNSEGNEKRTRFLEEESSYVGSAPSECTTEGGSDTGEEEEEEDEGEEGDDAASLASSGEREGEEGHEDRLLVLDEDDGASTLPDNVSEMGAMSGRASPSLSGRDTPDGGESTIAAAGASSTVDGGAREVAAREALLPRLPVTVRKQNAEGLEEKFGKFSLPPNNSRSRYRDDQRSLLSDSWSTDVAPSDNEGPTLMLPQAQAPPMYQLLPGGGQAAAAAAAAGGGPAAQQQAAAAAAGGGVQARQARSGSLRNGSTTGGEDKSDTWSLDAVASDTEVDRNDRSDIAPIPVPMGPPLNGGEMAANRGGAGGGGVEPSGGGQRGEDAGNGRMRRQSSGSSFYSEEGRRGSGGNAAQLPVSKPTSEVGEDSHAIHVALPDLTAGSDNGVEGSAGGTPSAGGGLKGKFSIEMRSKKAAILQGLHRIGDKMKRGGNSAVGSMRGSATMGDFPSLERNGGASVEERRAGSSGDLLNLDEPSPDDILAKYQRGGARSHQQPDILVDFSDSRDDLARAPEEMAPPLPVQSPAAPRLAYYSPDNLTQCAAFLDAKRKLRFVLSGVGFLPTWCATSNSRDKPRGDDEAKEELIALLQFALAEAVFLAEAVNGRERALCAQIRETIRCLGVFTPREVRKLVRSLKEDHRRRASYTLYLQQSRLSLLRLQAALERLTARVKREKSLTEECLVEMWINRFYLPVRQPALLGQLERQFELLGAQDEKTEWVRQHMERLWRHLEAEAAFRAAGANQREYARKCVERTLMARIYHMAFYPNCDADYHRDDVLHKALQRLASTVSPDHGQMAIPEALRGECPWPSAQHEIAVINAFKSPRDKLACIRHGSCSRACQAIVDLLFLARSSAAADDITPILVYVIVMANPANLLSNVQYIEGFYGQQLAAGDDAYWWTQFRSAIEFIKTLL
ncbi:rme-6 [Pristionchus pacificus]|uniref:Rme-6 n=1 Tax=Pristionchus pacificus TaxID=54126 RepID=A0A2A6BFT2_PRIPA|nr:rme-6 [Pristionchus pacificus]|eukprot:PDM64754.1 rme-6 [Pristionchus pacificus]